MRCSQCERDAVVDRPYAADHLCDKHLVDSVRARARSELHRQVPRFRGGTIAVALSGGKDSAAALELTQWYFARRPNVRIVALSIDEGIDGYRALTLRRAEELVARLGVEHRVLRSRDELGLTTDQGVQQLPSVIPCSYCGVWRRQLLNRGAKSVGAGYLVLGFNLDDLAQTVLMNLARADLERLRRMAPHRDRQPGLVPRIAPLASVPEREVFLYSYLLNLPNESAECPHAHRASRNVFRDVVWKLEEELPGTRHALLRTQAKWAAMFPEVPAEITGRCRECGEPANGDLCRACQYLETAKASLSAEVTL